MRVSFWQSAAHVRDITLPSHHVGDLDDWVLVSFWEDTLSARALDIKTEDAQRRNLGPFAFGWMRYKLIPPDLT